MSSSCATSVSTARARLGNNRSAELRLANKDHQFLLWLWWLFFHPEKSVGRVAVADQARDRGAGRTIAETESQLERKRQTTPWI